MRLTKQIREDALSQVLTKKIKPQIDACKSQLTTLAKNAAYARYPKKVREWLAAAPEGGVSTRIMFCLRHPNGSLVDHELLEGSRYTRRRFSIGESIPVIAADAHNDELLLTPAQEDRARKILTKMDSILKEKEEIVSTLKQALGACSTVKQLHDRYPELVKYLPQIETQGTAIAITNDDVKRVLAA